MSQAHSTQPLLEALTCLKRDIRVSVERAFVDFYQSTGITPSQIDFEIIDVSSSKDTVRRFCLGEIRIGLGDY